MAIPELEGQRSGGVVDQALALDEVSDPLRNADALRDGCGGERIRGRNHGAQDQAEFPVESGKEPGRTQRNPDHSEGDQAESQQKNADHVVGKFAPGCDPRGRIKKRRENDEEDEVGIQRDFRDSRNEAEQCSCNHENDGIGDLELSCQGSEGHDEEQEQQEYQFYGLDAASRHHGPGISFVRLRGKYKAGWCGAGAPRLRRMRREAKARGHSQGLAAEQSQRQTRPESKANKVKVKSKQSQSQRQTKVKGRGRGRPRHTRLKPESLLA